MPQSAAAPSPFTPIADYAFLSNCHTGALVAPDGTIDWLCVPRFDSPSVFGSLLDRGAGAFRLGPFGINVPSNRAYEPGTNTLVTSWKTSTGWAIVRDALTIRPAPRRGHDHAAHTPASRRGRGARARADRRVLRGQSRGRARLRAGVRLRQRTGRVVTQRGSPPGRGDWSRPEDHAADRHADRDRGAPRPGPARAASRGAALLRARLGRGRASCAAGKHRGRQRAARCHEEFLAQLARASEHPGPWAGAADPALSAHDQGPHVHADRSDGGGADHLAPGDPGRGAQLGLPLHLDARLDVHAPGAALPQSRLGGE